MSQTDSTAQYEEGPETCCQLLPLDIEVDSRSNRPFRVHPKISGKRKPRRSRTGCKNCKDRKIKCDERRPSCLICISRGDRCPYSGGSPGRSSTNSSPASQTESLPLILHSHTTSLAPLPLLEMELIHNFVTYTHQTLSIDLGIQELWRGRGIELGFRCDYILRAVLAVSALHLAHRRPDRRDFYTRHAMMFHQDASRSAMEPLRKVDKEHDASLFLFSVLTVYFALASRDKSDGHPFADNNNFPDWAFLVGGAKSVVDVIGVDLEDPLISPFMAWANTRIKVRAKCEESKPPWLQALQQRIHASVLDEDLLQTYDSALHELDVSFQSTQDQSTPKDVLDAMIWLWIMSNSLLPLLKTMEQEAVAIFAHFCVLLKLHEGEWFLDGWADHLLLRSYDILDEEHKSWITWSFNDSNLALAQMYQ